MLWVEIIFVQDCVFNKSLHWTLTMRYYYDDDDVDGGDDNDDDGDNDDVDEDCEGKKSKQNYTS